MVRGAVRGVAILTVLLVALAPTPAYPDGKNAPAAPAQFSAEVIATPSYHVVEIPKVEEGGEGFSWAYLNQQPESWGRALAYWPGPAFDATFATSVPQQGPLAGHRWKAPGAWTSYPPGGDRPGEADFGEPARFPLGPTVETPGGTMRVLSFSGHADADQGLADFAFGAFQGTAVPVSIGFARSFASAQLEEGAVVSSGWALARDVKVGDVHIGEIRSDATVRATADGETGTWKLTIAGVAIGGQRLEWTNDGLSFAPGSEDGLSRLNEEMAKGAEGFRSEFRLVPGRVWRDDAGTHVQSGFLQMGHRPVILENSPGQRMSYALSVVSAGAIYRLGDPEIGLGDDLPAPTPAVPAGGPVVEAAPVGSDLAPPPSAELPAPSSRVAYDGGGLGQPAPAGAAVGVDIGTPLVAEGDAAAGEVAAGLAPAGGGGARAAPATVTGLGGEAARKLRGGIGLVALVAVAAGLAVLRAARRQLELIGANRGGG